MKSLVLKYLKSFEFLEYYERCQCFDCVLATNPMDLGSSSVEAMPQVYKVLSNVRDNLHFGICLAAILKRDETPFRKLDITLYVVEKHYFTGKEMFRSDN